MHKAEALGEAVRPFEVVEQAPHGVLLDANSLGDSIRHRTDVRREIFNPSGVIQRPAHLVWFGERGAILTDDDGRKAIAVTARSVGQELGECVRLDGPQLAEASVLDAGVGTCTNGTGAPSGAAAIVVGL